MPSLSTNTSYQVSFTRVEATQHANKTKQHTTHTNAKPPAVHVIPRKLEIVSTLVAKYKQISTKNHSIACWLFSQPVWLPSSASATTPSPCCCSMLFVRRLSPQLSQTSVSCQQLSGQLMFLIAAQLFVCRQLFFWIPGQFVCRQLLLRKPARLFVYRQLLFEKLRIYLSTENYYVEKLRNYLSTDRHSFKQLCNFLSADNYDFEKLRLSADKYSFGKLRSYLSTGNKLLKTCATICLLLQATTVCLRTCATRCRRTTTWPGQLNATIINS